MVRAKEKRYRDTNKEALKERSSTYRQDNLEKMQKRESKYRGKNREKLNGYTKDYRVGNLSTVRENEKRYRETNGDRCKVATRKYKYGLSEDDFQELLAAQDGKCAGCGTTEKLCVDHDHETRKVRGLLCRKCNATLGFVNDDPKVLQNLIRYLEP